MSPVLAAFLAAYMLPATAYEEHRVHSPDGTEIFRVRFFDVGDGKYLYPPEGLPAESTWNLSEPQKRDILQAADYWAQVIQPEQGAASVILNVGTFDFPGAMGTSAFIYEDVVHTASEKVLQGNVVPDDLLVYESHGQFVMGKFNYAAGESIPSQIAHRPGIDVTPVAVHEIGHVLGLSNHASDLNGELTPHFSDPLSSFGIYLLDDHGASARPGQTILCDGCNIPAAPGTFDTRLNRPVFAGPHVREALEDAMPGLPVSMVRTLADGTVPVDTDYMSHIELRNSLISHQSYRNYARPMEAELAVFQDLGYTIDRRNFFGRSIYGDGLNIVNERPFHARNAEGTAYMPGSYNTAGQGLGLHVYGSHNRVHQVADLLSAGAGGAGIRVDGESNSIVIEPGVRVHALGLNGQGVMFTYGKSHELVQRGDVQATGPLGVGLRFDMGHNLAGDDTEHRGSYMRYNPNGPLSLPDELKGPLVRQVHLTGRVAGSEAALYASPNAWVEEIHVMQGADITGDIVSDYAQRDEAGALRLTTVSFGFKADEQGRATSQPDNSFSLRHTGNLRGENLHIALKGGVSALDGDHTLHGMHVESGATLAGNGHFTLGPEGRLRNDGTIAPGLVATGPQPDMIGRIEVDGAFQQGNQGRLLASFAPSGAHDVLAMNGTAQLDGTLALRATPGWYPDGWIHDAALVQASSITGEFGEIAAVDDSPTLAFTGTPIGQGVYRLGVQRARDAYSRHAADDNARNAGLALRHAASNELAPLLAALDFSASDGSVVRTALNQVSPAIYSAATAAALHHDRQTLDLALNAVRSPGSTATADPQHSADGWHGYATAFGGRTEQDARGSAVGYDASSYGVVLGASRSLATNRAIRIGGHLDIAHLSVSPDSPLAGKARSTAVGLGLQAAYAPDAYAGPYIWAGLRLGIDDTSFKRRVSAGGYNAAHTSDWTGQSAAAEAGAGYRWKVTPGLAIGPIASLNYLAHKRPRVEEDGAAATRLLIEEERVDALRSSLGLSATLDWTLDDGTGMAAHAQASWDREWLSRTMNQSAAFAAAPWASFTTRNTILPRDTVALSAGLSWRPTRQATLSAAIAGRVGSGYDALSGEVRLRWAFD